MIYFKHITISFSKKKSVKICWDTGYHLKTCENSELMPATRTPPTQKKLPWQRCITPNIAFRLTTRFWQIMGFFTQNHCLILLNSRYPLRLCLMLLSFLTQQNHQHTQSQILSWNTDAFPANFSQIKRKQLIKIITLFSMRTFFTIKPSHFPNQMTALLMNKSMSQEGQWREYYYFLLKTQQQEKEIPKNL